MNHEEMLNALASQGMELTVRTRERWSQVSLSALRRELLMRGVLEYDNPDPAEEDLSDDPEPMDLGLRTMLGLPSAVWSLD